MIRRMYVEHYAKKIDRAKGDWFEHVDNDTLDLSHGRTCVLGQAFEAGTAYPWDGAAYPVFSSGFANGCRALGKAPWQAIPPVFLFNLAFRGPWRRAVNRRAKSLAKQVAELDRKAHEREAELKREAAILEREVALTKFEHSIDPFLSGPA